MLRQEEDSDNNNPNPSLEDSQTRASGDTKPYLTATSSVHTASEVSNDDDIIPDNYATLSDLSLPTNDEDLTATNADDNGEDNTVIANIPSFHEEAPLVNDDPKAPVENNNPAAAQPEGIKNDDGDDNGLVQVAHNFIPDDISGNRDDNFVIGDSPDTSDDDNTAPQILIPKVPNANYRIELAPLGFDISKNLNQIQDNTIVLKKEKSGIIKGYLVTGGKFKGPYPDLGLSAAETNVLAFPNAGEEHVVIEREEFPELVDKVCMRCGIRSAHSLLGTVLAVVFSLGCGVTTVAAFFKMLFAASVALTPIVFVGAAVIGVSTFVANYRMSQFDLPEMFLAGYNYLFKNRYLKKDDQGNVIKNANGKVTYEARNISPVRMFLLGFGAVCSLFLGIAFAVLTYMATIKLYTAFAFLTPVIPLLPIAGVILGGATLISLSLIMFKATSDLLKSDTLVDSMKKISDNLFHFDKEKDKGFLGHAKRVGIWLVFGTVTVVAVGLTFLGAIYTQIACVGSINDTFNITSNLIKGFTAAIVGGLAFISQVPFTVMTTVNPLLQLFYRWPEKPVAQANETQEEQAPVKQEQEVAEIDPNDPGAAKGLAWIVNSTLLVFGGLASLVNAVANGLIALDGQKFDIKTYEGVGTVGAIANSFNSTLGNTVSKDIPEPVVENQDAPEPDFDNLPVGGSFADIMGGLQKDPGNTHNNREITSIEELMGETGENDGSFNAPQTGAQNNTVAFFPKGNDDLSSNVKKLLDNMNTAPKQRPAIHVI